MDEHQKRESFIQLSRLNPKEVAKRIKAVIGKEEKQIVVCSPSHILVPILRIAGFSNIVLDAGWPLSDSNGTRRRGLDFIPRYVKNVFTDFIAFQLARMVFVESEEQLERVSKRFFVQKSKLRVVFTGVNESRFRRKKALVPPEVQGRAIDRYNVLFRGKYNEESGIEILIKIAAVMKDRVNVIIASDSNLPRLNFPENCFVLTRPLKDEEIEGLYGISDFSIGQLGSHRRLTRTIPHKFFESAFFGVPYLLSSNSLPIIKLVSQESVLVCDTSRIEETANKLLKTIENDSNIDTLRRNFRRSYERLFSQFVIQAEFSRNLCEFNLKLKNK